MSRQKCRWNGQPQRMNERNSVHATHIERETTNEHVMDSKCHIDDTKACPIMLFHTQIQSLFVIFQLYCLIGGCDQ